MDKLKINDGKTEFMIVGTRQQLEKSILITSRSVIQDQSRPCLGTWFDGNLNLKEQYSISVTLVPKHWEIVFIQ